MAKHKFVSISLTVRDRAISSKFLTHRVSEQNFRTAGYLTILLLPIFKKFSPPQKWRPFWILEFLPKMAKHKFASISLTVWDRAISSKFSIRRVSKECTLFAIFQKFSPPQKWRPFRIFEFLPKMAKHKFVSISLTMRDRTISSKFSTHKVSKECDLCNFQKIFPSPKMAAISNFRIFAQNGKTQICFYLLNHAR